jgi:hypothetical protein
LVAIPLRGRVPPNFCTEPSPARPEISLQAYLGLRRRIDFKLLKCLILRFEGD